jgi:hypothetical protein
LGEFYKNGRESDGGVWGGVIGEEGTFELMLEGSEGGEEGGEFGGGERGEVWVGEEVLGLFVELKNDR